MSAISRTRRARGLALNEPTPALQAREENSSSSSGQRVQFFQDDSCLMDNLSRLVAAALVGGDSALIVATPEHRDALWVRLQRGGLDFAPALAGGRFICLDAAATLAQIMLDGAPDHTRFHTIIGNLIRELCSSERTTTRRVAVFGEMVSLLLADGQQQAAIRLEQLWNELAEKYRLQLHCSYPISSDSQGDGKRVEEICSQHADTLAEQHTTNESSLNPNGETAISRNATSLEAEIGERQKLQSSLRKHETELRDFVDNAVVPMHWVAEDGTILWANRAELTLLNYKRDEYIGHHIAEFHADKRAISDILERLGAKQELRGYKALLRCKDGETRAVRIYSNQSDEFGHTRCLTIDVTDRELSERRGAAQLKITQLLASCRSLAEASDSILETICGISECDWGAVWQVRETTQDLKCETIWRKADTSFLEFERLPNSCHFQKGIGMPGRVWESGQPAWIADLSKDENFPRKLGAVTVGLRSGFAFPIAVNDRIVGIMEFFSRQVRQPDPEFMTMMAGIGIQVGQFLERQQLDDARNRLAAIVESSDDAIISKDLNGIVTSWNGAAERIFGYKPEEMIGKPITLIIPAELQAQEPRILASIQAGKQIDHFETVRLHKAGNRLDISLTISPIKDQNGKIIGAAKIARDITKQRKLEMALHTSERLASVGRLAATVAHEINNPLEAVTNCIFLAKTQPELGENTRHYLSAADRELRRVAHIAQQTLGFYRNTSRPVSLVLSETVDDVLSIYDRKFKYKNLNVQTKIDPALTICTLQGELKQILSNLVANAIDASDEGGKVLVRAHKCRDRHSDRDGVRITIADQGKGIPVSERRRVFEPFFTTKKDIGTGLGLWITKELLQKQGGRIQLRSSNYEPTGTVIKIYLPSMDAESKQPGKLEAI